MKKVTDLIRTNILGLIPYSSARAEFKGKAEVFLDANENPFDEFLKYNRYPDPLQRELKEKICELKKVAIDNVFLSNGSDEAIDILIRIFCEPGNDSILTFTPGFGMYKVAASINNVKVKSFPLDRNYSLDFQAFQQEIDSGVKLVFLCSPNNPTGNSLPEDEVVKLCKLSNSIIVVDEAYIDFSPRNSMIRLINDHKNLVILQTLSKAHGGAGIRVGMAFADSEIIHYMNNVKMPYNMSQANQVLAMALLSTPEQYQKMLRQVLMEKKEMFKRLQQYRGIRKIFPSDANFYLIQVEEADFLYGKLIEKGIVVRNLSRKKGCEGCLRITVGTNSQNAELYKALDSIFNSPNL